MVAGQYRMVKRVIGLAVLTALLLGPGLTQAQSGVPTVTSAVVSSDAGDATTYILGETIRSYPRDFSCPKPRPSEPSAHLLREVTA